MGGHMPLRLAIISTNRADEGVYLPLVTAMQKDREIELMGDTYERSLHLDWVIVLGDTWPMLEWVEYAVKRNIPVAHIHGGDRTGGIDESIRHAITRFAHIHFPSIKEHADRLLRMGEESWRIHTVGPLGIYAMPEAEFMTKDVLRETLRIDVDKPIVIILQHPVQFQQALAGEQMRATLEAMTGLDVTSVVIYPNDDTGSEDMIREIKKSLFPHFRNLPYLTFVSLLKHSACIVGNSSCGLVEAPLFGVPCVNVGTRQSHRRSGYAIHVSHDSMAIQAAIQHVLYGGHTSTCVNPYAGYTGGVETIIKTLKETEINERLLQKSLWY
jgi:GDP/UDP-N,N'-diacetylbacillosamine 2-epimerase (hydrolysing)